jgi:type IV secretory pathway VirB2 component (pilin)
MIFPDQKSRVTRKLLGAIAYSLAIAICVAIGFLISDWVWRKPWENGQTMIVIGLAIAFFIRWLARTPKS